MNDLENVSEMLFNNLRVAEKFTFIIHEDSREEKKYRDEECAEHQCRGKG